MVERGKTWSDMAPNQDQYFPIMETMPVRYPTKREKNPVCWPIDCWAASRWCKACKLPDLGSRSMCHYINSQLNVASLLVNRPKEERLHIIRSGAEKEAYDKLRCNPSRIVLWCMWLEGSEDSAMSLELEWQQKQIQQQ